MSKYALVLVMAVTMVFGINALAEEGCAGKAACPVADVKKDAPRDHGQMFANMDANKDGSVDLKEFTDASEARAKKAGREFKADEAKARFEKMDADKDGKLTQEEMKAGHGGNRGEHKAPEAAK